jgi:hypothetical protein
MPDELPEPKTPTQQCEPEYVVTVAGEILDDDTVNGEFTQSLLFANIFELTQYESVDTFRKYDTTRRDEAAKLLANFSINALCRSVT